MAKCPINCGDCCKEWGYVEELWTPETSHLNMDDPCPNLGASGCVLPRDKRPKICREHLCDRALQVLQLLKSKEEASASDQ